MSEHDGYEVGYRKPPKGSQFQKGRSGNASGRPRTSASLAQVVQKVSKQLILTKGPKGQRRMPKLEANVTQLLNKALAGDLAATKIFLKLASAHLESAPGTDAPIILEIVGPKTD